MHRRLFAIVLAAVLFAVALAACSDEETPSAEPVGSTGEPAADVFNDADVAFAQGMIPHHEQAVEMAAVALEPTVEASPDVQDLATRIKAAQEPEVALMTDWLTAWGEPVEMGAADGHDMETMAGMMTDDEMHALEEARGAAFDELWLEMMIRHHEGAIATAEGVKADGENPDIARLADQIVAAQQAEIDEMEAVLRD
jgi:uncharacterized protein (DUF305 family)